MKTISHQIYKEQYYKYSIKKTLYRLLLLSNNPIHMVQIQGFLFTFNNFLVAQVCVGIIQPNKSLFIGNTKNMLHIWS